jgi:hypothetical protein
LFEKQSPIGNYGYCPTGGWVVKKSIFDKTGLFDENLRLHQDTAMYIKFAAVGTMVAGNLRVPVAMRRIHDANRITASRSPVENYNNQLLMWKSLWKWGKKNLDFHKKRILMRKFLNHSASGVELYNSRKYTALFHYIKLLKHDPTLLFEYYYWRRMIGISIKCLKV